MAIFQPTSIIPSSFTQGTVDVNDTMEISWQVNGNSAMTAFQIDFYLNDVNSTPVHSTGKLPKTGETQEKYNLPFYSTDRFGNPQFFTYNAVASWENKGFTNGNNYKFKITQFYNEGDVEKSVVQTSASTFITRSKPTLKLYTTANNYVSDKTPLTNGTNISTSIGYFVADYEQDQGDPVRWIRWQVATAFYNEETDKWSIGDILADTGDIYTPTLNYEFNGFFNGQRYAIRAICESESGQQANSNTDTDGWIYFNIKYDANTYNGKFTAQCLNKENAALLKWEGVEVIPPTVSPKGYDPDTSNGSVTLAPKNTETGEEYSVTWEKTFVSNNNESQEVPMNFPPNWTAAIRFRLGLSKNIETQDIEFSGQTKADTGEETHVIHASGLGLFGKYTIEYAFPTGAIKITNVSFDIEAGSNPTYDIDDENRKITVSISATRGGLVFANVKISYTCYRVKITKKVQGIINSCNVLYESDGIFDYDITYKKNEISAILYSESEQSASALSLIASVKFFTYIPLGKLFEIQGNNVKLNADKEIITLDLNNENKLDFVRPDNVDSATIIITPTAVLTLFYYGTQVESKSSKSITLNDWQRAITSISIFGGDSGITVDNISVYKGDGSNILPLYESDMSFEPVWDSKAYQLYMSANFNGNLEGGTGTASGAGFLVYRQEVGKSTLTPIATLSARQTQMKDYGISSRKAYKYRLCAKDSNQAFMGDIEAENIIATNYKNYSLLVCDYDKAKDEYHVRKQYLFALNLGVGSVGNNNSPTLNTNFTPYPTRMPSVQNYASGTLQGLIGAIYTVPALIEQIGNYKWTAKPSTMDYFDSVDLEKELYDLSVAPYQLFLRDMKGRLRMVHTSGPISMTTNIKQKQQSISISLPWVEVGDASDVTIIQTPDDYGWDNDNQVLDVKLDVDVETGELSATYPYPYNGTKFYLTGTHKEDLTANTPLGTTPAQFELSDTATEKNDGEVVATVTENTENK